MKKYRLTKHHDILPGVRKRKGTIVLNLPLQRVREGVSEGWLEPVEYGALPEDYPMRDMLVAHDYYTVAAVEQQSDEQLLAIDGIGPKRLKEIRSYNPKSTDEEE